MDEKDKNMIDQTLLPEAGATAWTTYKRTDGFEVSLTIRDINGITALDRLEKAIEKIKASGGVPVPLRGGFNKTGQREPEYVEGRSCPSCGQRLVYTQKRDGTKYIKCSQNKWDKNLNKATGCPYVEWPNQKQSEFPAPEDDF